LVHQTGLADTTVSEDNDLSMLCQTQNAVLFQVMLFRFTLRRTFFLELIVAELVVLGVWIEGCNVSMTLESQVTAHSM
jgi:hypothetical protein